MTPEVLLSITGDVMVAVRAKDEYDIRDFVRVKKIVEGLLPYHEDYDFNKDGVVDEADETWLRRFLMNNF